MTPLICSRFPKYTFMPDCFPNKIQINGHGNSYNGWNHDHKDKNVQSLVGNPYSTCNIYKKIYTPIKNNIDPSIVHFKLPHFV